MMKLSIQNQKPLVKVGKRGNYSEEEKNTLLTLPMNSNLSLELRALSAKWNRDFDNVRRRYYKLQEDKNKLVEKELAKREQSSISKFTVGKSKENVSKYSPHENPWTEFEDEILMEALENSTNKKKSFEELSEVLDRTFSAINARYYYLLKKQSVEVGAAVHETINLTHDEPTMSFIPETPTDLFLEEVSVTMYRSLDGSLHEKAQDAVKANIRTIIDSIPDKDSDDRAMHLWFVENKEKVNYLTNINVEELW